MLLKEGRFKKSLFWLLAMSYENNNLANMPLDMVIIIMKSVLEDGFGSFFNLFKSWGQSKRDSVIIYLLNQFPVCDLYPLRLTSNDVECFD